MLISSSLSVSSPATKDILDWITGGVSITGRGRKYIGRGHKYIGRVFSIFSNSILRLVCNRVLSTERDFNLTFN